MEIQLMTDSGADIPVVLREKLQVEVIPLYLHFSDGEYRSGVTMDLSEYHQKVEELNEVPQTAAPSPRDFYEAFKKVPEDRPIIMLSISKELSSTYQNAVAGKELLLEEEPDRKIAVINTKTASIGITLLLHEAKLKIQAGFSFEQIVEHIEEKIEHTVTLFILKTLDNLIRGGRLSKVKGKIAETLNIKLLMRGSEQGTIEVTEKVRGEKKALRRFVEQIGEYTKNTEKKSLFMSHCNDKPGALQLLTDIKNKYSFKETFLADIGPLIAAHGGNGAIVIAFFKD